MWLTLELSNKELGRILVNFDTVEVIVPLAAGGCRLCWHDEESVEVDADESYFTERLK